MENTPKTTPWSELTRWEKVAQVTEVIRTAGISLWQPIEPPERHTNEVIESPIEKET